jgi:hypothetical protein
MGSVIEKRKKRTRQNEQYLKPLSIVDILIYWRGTTEVPTFETYSVGASGTEISTF